MRFIFLLIFLTVFSFQAFSQQDSVPRKPFFFIKPEYSVGAHVNNGNVFFNWQVGGSVFHFANATQRYGLTVNYININDGQVQYLSTGIVIEMTMFKYMYARVGTVGYLGLRNADHAFGITSNVGFEYAFGFFVLSAGYKGDALIISNLPSNNNFYIQTSFRIDRKVKKKTISPGGF